MVNAFEAFTIEHYAPIAVSALVGWGAIAAGRNMSDQRQRILGVVLAVVVLLSIFVGSVIVLLRGQFDVNEDLPLYLCRIIAWVLPVVMWKKNRYWLGVFYFWILAGTLQAIITPDLAEGFPDYFYFRYWLLHAGLIVTIIYALVVYKIRIGWADFWRAVVLVQGYLVGVHLINIILGSNYAYTVEKPPGGSVVDLFGPWPWYLLGGEILMFCLSLVLMIPFVIARLKIFRQSD